MRRIKAFIAKWPILSFCAAVALSLAAVQGITIWWYSFPPKRPTGVSPNAVFIWAPGVGLPAPKRGDWVNCWYDAKRNVDMCRFVDVGGALGYQGAFLPYRGKSPIPDDQLVIDTKTTGTDTEQIDFEATGEESSQPGPMGVPPLHLRNGNVLIPAKVYRAQKYALEEEEWEATGRSPRRPQGVTAAAVYIPWPSPSPFKGPPTGIWVNCWFDASHNADMCRVDTTEGELYYQGQFLPYQEPTPLPDGSLAIDPRMTSAHGSESDDTTEYVTGKPSSAPLPDQVPFQYLPDGNVLERDRNREIVVPKPIPFLYLRNGSVLLPARDYEAEKKWLDKVRAAEGTQRE